MISDAALGVVSSENTVTVTPPSSQIHPSTSHQPSLESQCRDPFRPTAWRGLTSIVRKPQRWQLTSSAPLKTTKMPLRFRQHTTTEKRSRVSSPTDLDSTKSSLPKGWVYEAVEVTKRGQGRGGRPGQVPDARRPANPPQASNSRNRRRPAARPVSPTPPGFEHNRGPAFIPFRIQDNGRQTPARYIRAHLDAPNPYVEGRLSLDGPTYHSEIHAAAVHDIDIPPPPITADILRLLHTDYMGHDRVDEALGEIGDRSLIAEVTRYRRLERKRKAFQDSITRIEDQLFTCDIERRMCVSRLEAARAMVRIQSEMQRNQQAFRLSPWSVERGRLP
jgi:hypothetical protein